MNANEPLPDQSLADAVVDRLRAAISSGMYKPGERLVERRLAHEFGISHIPLREALARLTEEGLVVRLPRRGARVASLTPACWRRSPACAWCLSSSWCGG